MSTNYTVSVSPFAERHFIKGFRKKYKNRWDATRTSIERHLKNLDVVLQRKITTIIAEKEGIQIGKTEFRIAGTKQSRHTSGNRCIIAVHTKKKHIEVLLVYGKTDLTGSGNETAQWKNIIKKNYPEYKNYL